MLFAHPVHGEERSAPEVVIKYFELTSGRLAFVLKKTDSSDIWVLDFETLVIKPLVATPGQDNSPNWSPDGQTLVFDSEVDGDREIFSVRADGSGLKRLTTNKGDDRDPDWSPDGAEIVFASARGEDAPDIYTMKPDGTLVRPLGLEKRRTGSKRIMPRWSPRGGEIIYASDEDWPGWDIILYDRAQKRARMLTTGYRSFSRPAWHPAGSAFLLSYGSREEIDLWQFKKGAKELTPVVVRAGKDLDGVWTDDASKVFFSGELSPGKNDFQLFIWDSAKNEIKQVASALAGTMLHPTWTPLSIQPEQEQKDASTKNSQAKTDK
ncbi:MAG TPA: hypothetical protein PLP17_00005 [Oligoflexia bacterium]|nr:hypothetical protein [Oligoflexia bacterium]